VCRAGILRRMCGRRCLGIVCHIGTGAAASLPRRSGTAYSPVG
jgi:hypothetical protein